MATHFECDYVEAKLGRWGFGLRSRLMAAGWFAGAACIPVLLVLLLLGFIVSSSANRVQLISAISLVWLLAVTPISATGLMGFIFGCQIVDPLYRTTAWRAALRGTLVGFFSYVLFIVAWGVTVTAPTALSRTDSLSDVVSKMAMLFLIGFVVVGWLILIVSGLAGWLIYCVSIKHQNRFIDVPGEIMQTANLWIAIAILIFVANCITLMMLLSKAGEN
jgi:hypothetical protein